MADSHEGKPQDSFPARILRTLSPAPDPARTPRPPRPAKHEAKQFPHTARPRAADKPASPRTIPAPAPHQPRSSPISTYKAARGTVTRGATAIIMLAGMHAAPVSTHSLPRGQEPQPPRAAHGYAPVSGLAVRTEGWAVTTAPGEQPPQPGTLHTDPR
jgi:hypothetical protein